MQTSICGWSKWRMLLIVDGFRSVNKTTKKKVLQERKLMLRSFDHSFVFATGKTGRKPLAPEIGAFRVLWFRILAVQYFLKDQAVLHSKVTHPLQKCVFFPTLDKTQDILLGSSEVQALSHCGFPWNYEMNQFFEWGKICVWTDQLYTKSKQQKTNLWTDMRRNQHARKLCQYM